MLLSLSYLELIRTGWSAGMPAASILDSSQFVSVIHMERTNVLGELPAKVHTVDENFIVVRRATNLSLSHDLDGFHLYGTDLCVIADILGGNCYVIDFICGTWAQE